MFLHTWRHQDPHKPSSCATFTLNSHWGRASTGKKKSYGYACRVTSVMSYSLRPCRLWPARLLCQGISPGKDILEDIGQYRLPYPSRALYFLLPWLPTPLRTWCCQNPCDPSSCTTSTPGLHRGKSKSFREASGANPVDDPHAEVEIKPQLKPRGSVEEDPKPSHQLYQLQIKYT